MDRVVPPTWFGPRPQISLGRSVLIVAIAGGVGGAKLAFGLSRVLPPERLSIIVNTGDDFDHLGLRICPDLDTVMYTLAGISNRETGWGIAGETWNFLDALEKIGGETWFRLGDRDLATHIERTRQLKEDVPLSTVMADLAGRLGIEHTILPATDDNVRTMVGTKQGVLPFQDYFVRLKCEPSITGFEFAGADKAIPAPPVSALFDKADIEAIILCPSNPYVSIAPILAVPKMKDYFAHAGAPVIAVSPIVGGRALKGPAAKMMEDLGETPSARAIAEHYKGIVNGIVIHKADAAQAEEIQDLGIEVCVTNTVMNTDTDKAVLADDVIAFAQKCRPTK